MQKKTFDSNRRLNLPHINIKIEKVELKRGIPFEDRYLNAQFQHYFSESYAKAISSSSCISSSSFFQDENISTIMVKNQLCRTRSKSAPVSPKGTSPHPFNPLSLKDSSLTTSSKRKKSASISNFFRKISPRLCRNSKDAKPWIVVEFSQYDIDGPADKNSMDSENSFEMALKRRIVDDETVDREKYSSTRKTSKFEKGGKYSFSKLTHCLHKGITRKHAKCGKEDAGAPSGRGLLIQDFTDDKASTVNTQVKHKPPKISISNGMQKEYSNEKPGILASSESIGSCSLDIDVSLNESRLNVINASDNAIRSVSMDDLDEKRKEKSAYQLKERSASGQALRISDEPDNELNLSDIPSISSKKPSYLNISCSISGYSDYSHYHQSKDINRPRILSHSRDSSPMPGSKVISSLYYNSSSLKENGSCTDRTDFISHEKSFETKKYISYKEEFLEVNKKHLSSQNELSVVKELKNLKVSSSLATEPNETSYVSKYSNEKVEDGLDVSENKSIVQQRIERLNAQKHKENYNKIDDNLRNQSSIIKGSPPVFRHLRREFRDQLNVASKSNKFAKPLNQVKSSSSSAINGHHKNSVSEKCDLPNKPEGLPASSKILLDMASRAEPQELKKDGHYFLQVMNDERLKIEELLTRPLKELDDDSIPEEVKGKIRSAIGKATLLTTKKFSQFKELCEKNISQSIDEQFSTNSSDLEGFWDMVMLQVTDIHDTFNSINKLRKNGWKEEVSKKNGNARLKRPTALKGQSKSAPTTPEKSAKAAAAAKARDEARKKLIAAKKKGRQSNVQSNQNVEIFAP